MRFSGRRISVGIKPETVRGTAETSGFYWYAFLTAAFNDDAAKKQRTSVYNNIVKSSGLRTLLKSGSGSLSGVIWAQGIGYILRLLFGQAPTTTLVETTANKHDFSLANNNTHNSATMAVIEPNQNFAMPLSMIDSFKFTWVKDDFTKIEIKTMSKQGVTATNTATILTADDNEMLPKLASIFTATNLAGLDAASETDSIVSFSFEIKKNLKLAQTSKSKDAVDNIHNTDFEISGSVEKYYEDTTYKDFQNNDTEKALRIKMSDSVNMAGSTTPTSLTFDFAKVGFQNWKPGYGEGDISTETFDFDGAFSLGDAKAMIATLVNKAASY